MEIEGRKESELVSLINEIKIFVAIFTTRQKLKENGRWEERRYWILRQLYKLLQMSEREVGMKRE